MASTDGSTGSTPKATNVKNTVQQQSGIRSAQDINNEIAKLNEFYNARHNIVKKLLIHEDMKENLILWVIFSLFFYVLAFIGYYVGPDRTSQAFFSFDTQGLAFFLMPVFLFVSLFTVSAITSAIRRAVVAVPKIMAIPLHHYEREIKRFESNIAPLIIALPFIAYNLLGILNDLANNTTKFYSLLPTVILFLSWVVEWVLFGNILWLLIYYLYYIWKITRTYHYESELLTVVLKDEIKPIIHVGYEQSIVLGIFMIVDIVYNIFKGFMATDLIGSLILFILLPIITILPVNFVHKDLTKEIESFRERALTKILASSKGVFFDLEVPNDDKMEFIFIDRILYRLKQVHKSHKNYLIYVKIFISLLFPLIGYYATYGPKAINSFNSIFKTHLNYVPLFHFITLFLIH